jgi:hypothetical protein
MRRRLVIPGIILAALLVCSQAMAITIDALYTGLPTGTITQQDKVFSDFKDLNGQFTALGALVGTEIKTVTFSGFDVHTVSFTGAYQQNGVYDLSYVIAINPSADPTIVISSVGLGFDQSYNTGVIGTFQKQIWAYDLGIVGALLLDKTVTSNAGNFAIGNQKTLLVRDTIRVNDSSVNSASNSFIQTGVPEVPEPATLSLLGIGIVGLGFIARRRGNRG